METHRNAPARHEPRSGAMPSAGKEGPQLQLKRDLRGMSFDDGARWLAPVQPKRRAGVVQREDAPAGEAPALSEGQTSALIEILPFLEGSLRTEDTKLPAALAKVAQDTAGLLEKGSDEDLAYSLLLNWVATLSREYVSEVENRTLLQVQLLDAFAETGEARLPQIPETDKKKRAKLENWLVRVRAMRGFYASMTKGAAKEGDMPEQAPVSSLRQTVIGLALAQVGKVHAGQETDLDDDGKKARKGWRTLQRIYDAAYGGHFKNEEGIKRKSTEMRPKQGAKQGPDGKYDPKDMAPADVIGSWCGIFPTAITRMAGAGVPVWDGGGVNALPLLVPPDVPRPGDIVNKTANNHFGIITWVGALPASRTKANLKNVSLRTVEGNTDGGQILEHTSTLKEWDQGGWGIRQLEAPPKEKKAAT